ncbi:MAG: hypothetical protein KJ600_04860 [Nanoarchaeota archaeon]|nr:hypothetical protein [Nanoarchaeota archaeon]
MAKKEVKKKKTGLAILCLILGIFSIILFWIPFYGLALGIITVIVCGITLRHSEANRGLIITALVFGILAILGGLGITLLAGLLFGVASTLEEQESNPVATIGEIYASAETWDADADVDGLVFTLRPRDNEGVSVKSDGMLNLKLWKLECTENTGFGCIKKSCTKKPEDLLETWAIEVKKEDIGFFGFEVRAEYSDYVPASDNSLTETGCLEIEFVTPDNNKFTSLADPVYLIL